MDLFNNEDYPSPDDQTRIENDIDRYDLDTEQAYRDILAGISNSEISLPNDIPFNQLSYQDLFNQYVTYTITSGDNTDKLWALLRSIDVVVSIRNGWMDIATDYMDDILIEPDVEIDEASKWITLINSVAGESNFLQTYIGKDKIENDQLIIKKQEALTRKEAEKKRHQLLKNITKNLLNDAGEPISKPDLLSSYVFYAFRFNQNPSLIGETDYQINELDQKSTKSRPTDDLTAEISRWLKTKD